MFQEQNIAELLKIYDAVHVLEVKVLDPLLLKLYIKKANLFLKQKEPSMKGSLLLILFLLTLQSDHQLD
jgi:hypothetical protein